MNETRTKRRLPLAHEGFPFILIALVISLFLFYLRLFVPAVLAGIILLFIIYFFRDPERTHDSESNAVLTPADGRILDVLHLEGSNNPLDSPAVKISVFMSVFNVHVNRARVNGKVVSIIYNPGRFLSANLEKASEMNESNRITMKTDDGRKIVFVQIAGLIARRIVCRIKEGDYLLKGQRVGLIRFGSRLDVYLPDDTRIVVQPRDRVRAGVTALGYMP